MPSARTSACAGRIVPGSELFVVYNELRDTRARSFPDLASRALIIKANRLFRF